MKYIWKSNGFENFSKLTTKFKIWNENYNMLTVYRDQYKVVVL